MIAFDLVCAHRHRFEGWFSSSQDYDQQLSGGLLSCPVCGDVAVTKALSVPNVGRKGNQQSAAPTEAPVTEVATMSNAPEIPAAMQAMLGKLADMQREALKESVWVGGDFADEARAIHYGEAEERVIHGQTSAEEAEALVEEGVAVAPLLFPYIPDAAKN